jgi:hypothetical protein
LVNPGGVTIVFVASVYSTAAVGYYTLFRERWDFSQADICIARPLLVSPERKASALSSESKPPMFRVCLGGEDVRITGCMVQYREILLRFQTGN